jgi:hypothetical protein
MTFPDGKQFAFTIVDDTDLATLDRIRAVYETLSKYGLRTSKTVWVVPTNDESNSTNLGDSLNDHAYRAYIKDLRARGFEIALHGVRGGSSRRDEIARGLEDFNREIGAYPSIHINHSRNRDNLYWDRFRFSDLPMRLAASVAMSARSTGHDPASEYFWFDLAKKHIRYVRQFTFQQINLLAVNPSLLYRRADTRYVNYWFQTPNGANRDAFVSLLSPENLDRLARDHGVSLVYSHLGGGSFSSDGRVDPRFEARIKDLVSRNG